MKQSLADKLTSRKFWICVAAFLGSIGTGITGIVSDNTALATIGGVCTVVSAAIYAATEAYVDAASLKSEQLSVNVQATGTSRDTKELLDQALNKVVDSTAKEPATAEGTD